MVFSSRLIALSVFLAGCVAAQAQVAYTDFGPGGSYDTTDGGWGVNSSESLAMPFTSATTGTVSDVIAAFEVQSVFTAYLTQDDNGTSPGSVLESWTFFGTGAAQTLVGDGSASLVAGDNYWLEVTFAVNGNPGYWSYNSIGATGTFIFNNGTGWQPYTSTLSVFQVDTTPAPEPVTLCTLGVGAGLLLRRRRKA